MTTVKTTTEFYWSGSCDPCDPDNYWIDDNTGECVNAITNERTQHVCPGSEDDDD